MTPIADRPSEVARRTVPGHWEGQPEQGRLQRLGDRHPSQADDTPDPGPLEGTDAGSARAGFTKKLRHVTALLRQYLPKGTDLSGYTQRKLNAIAHRLNTRPRKCLNFAIPLEVFTQLRHHSPVALGT